MTAVMENPSLLEDDNSVIMTYMPGSFKWYPIRATF